MDYKLFEEFLNQEKIEYKLFEPMKLHTSFKIGGPADVFVSPRSEKEVVKLFAKVKELQLPYFVLGKGSNLLVSDDGIEGVVISLLSLNEITVCGDTLTALSGASLASVCISAFENSLEGLEFAYGIPGAVGGALYMNAGAYGGEMSQVVCSARYLDDDLKIKEIHLSNMELGYRTSVFKKSQKIILSVTFKLKKGESTKIKADMDDFLSRRKSKQPLEYPSAGSTFKRPEGYFAGALIEQNNFKGVSVGGAMVSEKHAGFVINYNNATCRDVLELMDKISDTVLKNNGVRLCPEVIFVGRK